MTLPKRKAKRKKRVFSNSDNAYYPARGQSRDGTKAKKKGGATTKATPGFRSFQRKWEWDSSAVMDRILLGDKGQRNLAKDDLIV